MDSVGFIALFVSGIFGLVAAKDAATQTSDMPQALQDLLSMQPLDYIRAGLFWAAVIIPMLHGRRSFLMSVVFMTGVGGFFDLLFPKETVKFLVKSEPDVIHMYLVQLLASLLAGRLANIAQSWDSRDPGVTASWCISGAMATLIGTIVSYLDYNKWHSLFQTQFVSMVIMTSFIFCIGFVLYTFKGSTFGRGNLDLRHRLSRHILFDVIFLFTVGLVYFGYPNVVLANVALEGFKPNGMHGHLIRMIGTSILGWALNGLMALGYQSEHDQKAFVFGRLVGYAVMLPILGLYQWKHRFVQADFSMVVQMVVGLGFVLGNLLCAYFDWSWPKHKRS